MEIDLRKCSEGDILLTRHGLRLRYVKALPKSHYYDHEVEYEEEHRGNGTRTHDGFVFRNNRKPEDEDIVEIIHL